MGVCKTFISNACHLRIELFHSLNVLMRGANARSADEPQVQLVVVCLTVALDANIEI